jgi:hypothetical protein
LHSLGFLLVSPSPAAHPWMLVFAWGLARCQRHGQQGVPRLRPGGAEVALAMVRGQALLGRPYRGTRRQPCSACANPLLPGQNHLADAHCAGRHSSKMVAMPLTGLLACSEMQQEQEEDLDDLASQEVARARRKRRR